MGKRLFVGNVPISVTEEALRAAFGAFGPIRDVDIIRDQESGRPRGLAFIEMEDPEHAARAIESLDGSDFGGRNLRVNEAQERRGVGGRH